MRKITGWGLAESGWDGVTFIPLGNGSQRGLFLPPSWSRRLMAPRGKLLCPGSVSSFPWCDKDSKTAETAPPAEPAAAVTASWGRGCPKAPANPVTSAQWGWCCHGEREMLILA